MISSICDHGIVNAISWSCVWPKMRSPEQGRITCGRSVRMVVTMMSAHTTRPPNAEASLPPRFQRAAWVSRITWGVRVDADEVGFEGGPAERRHQQRAVLTLLEPVDGGLRALPRLLGLRVHPFG